MPSHPHPGRIRKPDKVRLARPPRPRISPAFFVASHRTGVRLSATNKVRGQEKVSVVLIDDQETVLRALEVARAILGECIAGQRDAARTVERLVATLNKSEVIQALDRMNRRRILRRVDFGDGPPA